MNDLISRSALFKTWDALDETQDPNLLVDAMIKATQEAPAVDAEVVRCKDCKRYRGTNYGFMVCGKFDVISCEDDFCVWGERKMDAEVE